MTKPVVMGDNRNVKSDIIAKGGFQYTRVTAILAEFQTQEYVAYQLRVGKREAKRAGTVAMKFGKTVDELIRSGAHLLTPPSRTREYPWEVTNCLAAYAKWVNDYAPKNLRFGERLFDKKLLLTGEPDIYCGEAIVDIKCSTVIRPFYFFQLAAYSALDKSCNSNTLLAVLRLDKQSATYEFVSNKDVGLSAYECWEGFSGYLNAYRTYKNLQRGLKPKEGVYDANSYE